MKRSYLTPLEKRTIYGLVRYSNLKDSEIASIMNLGLSTFYSIRKRLLKKNLIKYVYVPMVNRLGCEILFAFHADFNPSISGDVRINAFKEALDPVDEIFLLAGDLDKGFLLGLADNFTSIERIYEQKTEMLSSMGIIKKKYPIQMIFPFDISDIKRFFDYSNVLSSVFSFDLNYKQEVEWFKDSRKVNLGEKEKKLFAAMVSNPCTPLSKLSKDLGISLNTVIRLRKKFVESGFLRRITIPALEKMGFEVIDFSSMIFNPSKPPKEKDLEFLMDDFVIFCAVRKFEMISISVYPNCRIYEDTKERKLRYLRENDLILEFFIRKYPTHRLHFLRNMNFLPITKKILNLK